MKEIQLTKGFVALVDDEDYLRISKHKWHSIISYRKDKSIRSVYAARSVYYEDNKKKKMIYMHREVLNVFGGEEVDHINGDGLFNCKANLRLCTSSQNKCNKNIVSGKYSSFRGVTFSKQINRWIAQIAVKRKNFHIGTFSNPIDAARAYDRMAKELHGPFARLNFPKKKLPKLGTQ